MDVPKNIRTFTSSKRNNNLKRITMGKAEIDLRIKFLEGVRDDYLRLSQVPGVDKERVLKRLYEVDTKIALLIQEKTQLK